MPTSHYTFKVPYRSLARTLQFINRKGGKVVRIESRSLSLPIQGCWNSSGSLEDREVDEIDAQPLPPFEDNLGKSTPPEMILVDSESDQASVIPELEEFASPFIAKSEVLESPRLPRLIRFFLEKLNRPPQQKSTR
jgi:hypothetical protein